MILGEALRQTASFPAIEERSHNDRSDILSRLQAKPPAGSPHCATASARPSKSWKIRRKGLSSGGDGGGRFGAEALAATDHTGAAGGGGVMA